MDPVKNLQLQPQMREEVLKRCNEQLGQWGLHMPPVEPLVMDFGTREFYRIGLIEFWVANEIEAGYCGKYMFVFDGQSCPMHSHKEKHETFFVVKGTIHVTFDGQDRVLREGDVLPVKTGKIHSFRAEGNALVLELSMPCKPADNTFEDQAIAEWLKKALG